MEEIRELAKTIWKKLEGAARVWPEQEPRIGKIFIDSVLLSILWMLFHVMTPFLR